MKKVGLCVCQETKNYGSQLQVLATEVAVQKLGYEYEINGDEETRLSSGM